MPMRNTGVYRASMIMINLIWKLTKSIVSKRFG